ncbi:MAG: TVP38/TMEM64 family protein [Holophagae bacterium]
MGGTRSTGHRWAALAVGAAAIGVGIALASRLGVFELLSLERVDELTATVDRLGIWAPAAFVAIWLLAAVLFLPGLPITLAGGVVFGAVWGTVWTTVGANLGATVAFLIARYLARGLVEERIAGSDALRRIDRGVAHHGWRMVLITRLVPVFPFNLQNYAYGLTDIPLSTFVLVSLPAMLPATIAYSFAAGSLRTGDLEQTLWYLAIAAIAFVVVSLLPSWLVSRVGDDTLGSRQ